jgi:hypothetical protein
MAAVKMDTGLTGIRCLTQAEFGIHIGAPRGGF